MYIQSFSIDKYGLFLSQKVENLPPGLILVLGKNEAGKSTLLHYLRCMICGIPPKRGSSEYKRIPCIEDGFSGSMHVCTSSSEVLELRRIYRAESRKEHSSTLYNAKGSVLDYTTWLDILGSGIDLEVYRNIFGISLSELVELTKDDARVKDMLYGASIGAGIKAPSSILQELEERAKKLYTPRGSKNALVNTTLSERDKVIAERDECLQIMEEYEELQYQLHSILEEEQVLEEQIKEQKRTLQKVRQLAQGYTLWKRISLLPDFSIENGVNFSHEIRDELVANDLRHNELLSDLELAKESLSQKAKECEQIHYIHELLEHEAILNTLEQQLPSYQQNLDEYNELEQTRTQLHNEINTAIHELDPSYTREHIEQYSIHFALEQEIATLKQEIATHSNIAFHKEESLKETQRTFDELEQKSILSDEEKIQLNEVNKLEHLLTNISEKERCIKQKKQLHDDMKQQFTHHIYSLPGLTWTDYDARTNLSTMNSDDEKSLRIFIQEYQEEKNKKDAIEIKNKEFEHSLNIKEKEQRTIRDTLFEYSHSHSSNDLEELEALECLIHAQERIHNRYVRNTHIMRSSLAFLFCIGITIFILTLLPSHILLRSLVFIVGFLCSTACTYLLYKLDRNLEFHSIKQQLAHIGNIHTSYEIDEKIEQIRRRIGLSGITQEERLHHRVQILRYLDIEKRAVMLQQEYNKEKQEALQLNTQYEQSLTKLHDLETTWNHMLQEHYLPILPLQEDALDRIMHLRKHLYTLLQEEQHQHGLLMEECANLDHLLLSLQELATVKMLAEESPFYTTELMLDRCMQLCTLIQQKKKTHQRIIEEKQILQEKISLLEKECYSLENMKIKERWQQWLASSQFPSFLTPETIDSFLQRIILIKEKLSKEQQIQNQKEKLHSKKEAFEVMLTRLLNVLPQKLILDLYSLPPLHIAKSLLQKFLEEKRKYAVLESLQKEYEQEQKKIQELQSKITRIQERIQQILYNSGCAKKGDFFRQYNLYEESLQKKKEKEGYIQSLLEQVYPRTLEEISHIFSKTSDEELEEQVLEAETSLERLEQKKHASLEEVGKIKEKLLQAEHGDISKYALQYSMLTSTIEDAMKEWYMLKIAKEVIIQAQKQFEEKYQPEVMRIAGDIMHTITCGMWNKIVRSADNIIKVRTAQGVEKLPEELSRGTQEQMYLSLRFAGACMHSMKTHEPLPLLLDDITVNFDYERTLGVAHAIAHLISGTYTQLPQHQVFLFTCHESVVESMLDVIPNATLLHMDRGYLSVN